MLTCVCFLGVLLALTSDDEYEDQKQDEDEAHEGNDHQEPPFLVEGAGFLGCKRGYSARTRELNILLPQTFLFHLGFHQLLMGVVGSWGL